MAVLTVEYIDAARAQELLDKATENARDDYAIKIDTAGRVISGIAELNDIIKKDKKTKVIIIIGLPFIP